MSDDSIMGHYHLDLRVALLRIPATILDLCVRIALIIPEQHGVWLLTEMMWILGVGKFSTVELSYFILVINRGVTI